MAYKAPESQTPDCSLSELRPGGPWAGDLRDSSLPWQDPVPALGMYPVKPGKLSRLALIRRLRKHGSGLT